MVVPFNKAVPMGREMEYIARALQNGKISGDGEFTTACSTLLEQLLGYPKVLLTTSCTHALEMIALLLDLEQGDEVIVPSFTFVSTANAFALRGARPVFADIRGDTLNLDERHLEELITPRTRAVVTMHYGGVGCEMDAISALCRGHGLHLVEDNAHGLFGRYRNRDLGTFGALGALSFHETKNFSCGEGGALLINDCSYIERAEILREKGTNRTRFFRGEVDRYTWVDLGSSYLPSEILAAFLFGQLEARDTIQGARRRIFEIYADQLVDWAAAMGARLPYVPAHCDQAYHVFYLLMPDETGRNRLIDHLAARGIHSVFHYLPLHLSPMGRRYGGVAGACPVTEDVSRRLLRLPFYPSLTAAQQRQVIESVLEHR